MSFQSENDESPTSARALDSHYGKGHRPYPRMVGSSNRWEAGCDCRCERADDGLIYATYEAAREASARSLTLAEHGPGAGQENAS